MTRSQVVSRWLSSTTVIVVTLGWLHCVGSGELASPPLSLDAIGRWLSSANAAIVTFVVVRLIAVAFGWYLLVITTLGCAARVMALPRATDLVDRFTPTVVRSLLGGVALLGVMTTPPAQPRAHDTMVELTSDPTDDTVTLHLVVEGSAAPTPPPPTTTTPTVAMPAPSPPPTEEDTTWTVTPGESFWSIAASHLTERRGAPVTDREVEPFWRQLIELNRSRLANPADPDLLFNGQIIELPAAG